MLLRDMQATTLTTSAPSPAMSASAAASCRARCFCGRVLTWGARLMHAEQSGVSLLLKLCCRLGCCANAACLRQSLLCWCQLGWNQPAKHGVAGQLSRLHSSTCQWASIMVAEGCWLNGGREGQLGVGDSKAEKCCDFPLETFRTCQFTATITRHCRPPPACR